MNVGKEVWKLYAVTDRTWLRGRTLYDQVEEALRGGATCIQLREKQMEEEALRLEARQMKDLCNRYHTPLIINDNVEIAIQCGADGVHIGQKDGEAKEARGKIGPDRLLGVSVQTVAQALAAWDAGADYLGVGAIFPTATKQDADIVSLGELKAICSAVPLPVVAIGGIGKENMNQLKGSGIAGVALVSAIFASEDVESECKALKSAWDKA